MAKQVVMTVKHKKALVGLLESSRKGGQTIPRMPDNVLADLRALGFVQSERLLLTVPLGRAEAERWAARAPKEINL